MLRWMYTLHVVGEAPTLQGVSRTVTRWQAPLLSYSRISAVTGLDKAVALNAGTIDEFGVRYFTLLIDGRRRKSCENLFCSDEILRRIHHVPTISFQNVLN